jgi:uncharacterized protein (TIRG00374 family)
VAQSISFWLSLAAIGRFVPFTDMLLMGVLTNLVSFVRITPGALGVREGVAALAAELVGFAAAEGLAASLLTRLIDWGIAFALGPFLTWRLAREASTVEATPAP